MLTDFPTGMAWFNYMASNPKVQTQYGTVEAFNATGSIAPLLTWDTKITVALAMIDGATSMNCTSCTNCDKNVASEIAIYLKQDGLYNQFVNNTRAYYALVPNVASSSSIPFAMPYTFANTL